MRFAALVMLITVGPALCADGPSRHGIPVDLKSYPQATPKETLTSLLKAAELKRLDYLLAQLTDPEEIDARAEVLAGGFKEAVKEAGDKLDAGTVKKLKRFLQEGEIETLENRASIRLKDVSDRVVRFRKIGARWYLLNTSKP